MWEFGLQMCGIGLPTLTAEELPLLQADQVQNECVQYTNSITWLGHASFLLRVDGLTILVDPFLSHRAASIQPIGTPRIRPAALTPAQLPPIDVILISHAHYDHCDRTTLQAIPHKESIRVFVPEGLDVLMREWGYSQTTPLPWHIGVTMNGVSFTCVPAIHHSRRTPFDYNTTHWGGFIIRGQKASIYFAGDTAYGPVFKEIGEQYGPIDYGLVPIGGYGHHRNLRCVHADPLDAVKIGVDVGCTQLIGMHWGALALTSEPPNEPPRRFSRASKRHGYTDQTARTLWIGQTIRTDS